jgi:thioesterase domain-containing protein
MGRNRRLPRLNASPGRAWVTIRHGSEQAPLICVHPIGGGVFSYFDVAKGIDPRRAVYGIQGDAEDERLRRISSFEELGRLYAALVAEKLRGPVVVCGWSLGGVIALELARALDGTEVAPQALILIDTKRYPVESPPTKQADVSFWLLSKFAVYAVGPDAAVNLRLHPDSDKSATLAEIYRAARAAKSRFLTYCRDEETLAVRFDFFCIMYMATFRPPIHPYYSGHTILICGADDADSSQLAEQWRAYIRGRLEITTAAGDHVSMMRPPLAEGLGRLIAESITQFEPASVS